MSQLLNRAALDYWADIDRQIDGPLRRRVRDSLGSSDYVDAWIDQMVQNALDMMPDDDSPMAIPCPS